jgi:hypothetical protein
VTNEPRCHENTAKVDGDYVTCGREAFARIPDHDGEGRPVARLVCWLHLFPVIRRQQEARSK